MVIYKYENKSNGKIYIGQSNNIQQCQKDHYKSSKRNNKYKTKFHKALHKYGIEGFDFKIIDTADTQEQLDEKENFWIKYYKSCDRNLGYNLKFGGSHGSWTKEVKDKISKTKSGRTLTENHKKNIGLSRLGRSQTEYQKITVAKALAKQWKITTPDNKTEIITNLRQYCKEHNLDQGNMHKVSSGIASQHKNYKVQKYTI